MNSLGYFFVWACDRPLVVVVIEIGHLMEEVSVLIYFVPCPRPSSPAGAERHDRSWVHDSIRSELASSFREWVAISNDLIATSSCVGEVQHRRRSPSVGVERLRPAMILRVWLQMAIGWWSMWKDRVDHNLLDRHFVMDIKLASSA